MRTETREVFVAFDNTTYSSEAECRLYEKENGHRLLLGLTLEQYLASLNGSDPDRANAVERWAYLIRQARIARGELKRVRRAEAPPEPEEPEAEADAAAGTPEPPF